MASRKSVTQCTRGEWNNMTERMRSCCPAPEGYSWRFMWSTKVLDHGNRGDCERREPKKDEKGKIIKRGQIIIRVAKGMSENETIDVLIHEVAHAYDMWTHHAWSGDHSDTFWIWNGRIYRRYWGLETG